MIFDDGIVILFFYCIVVLCFFGRYLNNVECVKCGYGIYQDYMGQIYCKKCLDYIIMFGREFRVIMECFVKLDYIDVNGYMYCFIKISFS